MYTVQTETLKQTLLLFIFLFQLYHVETLYSLLFLQLCLSCANRAMQPFDEKQFIAQCTPLFCRNCHIKKTIVSPSVTGLFLMKLPAQTLYCHFHSTHSVFNLLDLCLTYAGASQSSNTFFEAPVSCVDDVFPSGIKTNTILATVSC